MRRHTLLALSWKVTTISTTTSRNMRVLRLATAIVLLSACLVDCKPLDSDGSVISSTDPTVVSVDVASSVSTSVVADPNPVSISGSISSPVSIDLQLAPNPAPIVLGSAVELPSPTPATIPEPIPPASVADQSVAIPATTIEILPVRDSIVELPPPILAINPEPIVIRDSIADQLVPNTVVIADQPASIPASPADQFITIPIVTDKPAQISPPGSVSIADLSAPIPAFTVTDLPPPFHDPVPITEKLPVPIIEPLPVPFIETLPVPTPINEQPVFIGEPISIGGPVAITPANQPGNIPEQYVPPAPVDIFALNGQQPPSVGNIPIYYQNPVDSDRPYPQVAVDPISMEIPPPPMPPGMSPGKEEPIPMGMPPPPMPPGMSTWNDALFPMPQDLTTWNEGPMQVSIDSFGGQVGGSDSGPIYYMRNPSLHIPVMAGVAMADDSGMKPNVMAQASVTRPNVMYNMAMGSSLPPTNMKPGMPTIPIKTPVAVNTATTGKVPAKTPLIVNNAGQQIAPKPSTVPISKPISAKPLSTPIGKPIALKPSTAPNTKPISAKPSSAPIGKPKQPTPLPAANPKTNPAKTTPVTGNKPNQPKQSPAANIKKPKPQSPTNVNPNVAKQSTAGKAPGAKPAAKKP